MSDWITGTVELLGYFGVAVLMTLENIFPPIPSELIMPLAGFAAAEGELTLWGSIVAGSVGSVLGQFPLYWVGHRLGEDRIRRLADRYGKWLTVSSHEVDRAAAWFQRRGVWAVFICRLLPGIRSLISIPAGIHALSLWKFTLFSTFGITIWSAILAAAGYFLGRNYDRVSEFLGPFATVIVVLAVGVAVIWIGRRLYRCFKSPEEPCGANQADSQLEAS